MNHHQKAYRHAHRIQRILWRAQREKIDPAALLHRFAGIEPGTAWPEYGGERTWEAAIGATIKLLPSQRWNRVECAWGNVRGGGAMSFRHAVWQQLEILRNQRELRIMGRCTSKPEQRFAAFDQRAKALTVGRYGFWCFDCATPALATTYREACAAADAAGWRIIRGVNRCLSCVAADGRKAA